MIRIEKAMEEGIKGNPMTGEERGK
jgi:hypothetical protein